MEDDEKQQAGEERPIERSYQPATQDPGALIGEPECMDGKVAEERIEALYKRLQGSRRFLDAILEFCRQERTEEEVAEEFARLRKREFCIYGADVLCGHLLEAGGLEKVGGAAEEGRQPDTVQVEGVEYLDAAPSAEQVARLRTTEAGLAALCDECDLGRFEAVLTEDEAYTDIYRMLLDCCANDGGATVKQLGDAVDAEPVLQQPRLYAQYFLEKMADCDLVEWGGSAWCITELGLAAAQSLDKRG